MACNSNYTPNVRSPETLFPKRGELWRLNSASMHMVIMITLDLQNQHSPINGVVVHISGEDTSNSWQLGQYHENFAPDRFLPFHGSVELQQD